MDNSFKDGSINMDYNSSLSKAKGLGSARNGTAHMIHQRFTAIALVPLCIWFVISVILVLRSPKEMIPQYIISPINMTFIILFICVSIYHGMIGMRVIIEDYVHHKYIKIWSLIILYFVSIVTLTCGIISLFSMHIVFRIVG